MRPEDADTNMEERLEKLEAKMMAAEDQLDELNRCVWRQQQELDLLRAQLRQLSAHVQAMQAAAPGAADDIPPHW